MFDSGQNHRISVVEISIAWMSSKIRKDKIRDEDIRANLGVAPIKDKIRKPR